MSTTSSIGSFDFIRMKGPQVPKLAAAVEIIDRPGVDSVATRENADKAEEIQLETTEAISSLTTARSRADDYAGLKGERVTVEDELGRSTSQVLVIDVRVLRVKKVTTCSESSIDYIATAIWRLKPTQ